MSKYEPIDVVVDGIRCYWQVMASFGEHGKKALVCARYPYLDSDYNGNKEVEKSVPVPMPSLTMAEDGAVDFLAETFGLNEDEANQMRDLAYDIKWKKSAYTMLRNLAEADKA
jgi:hypothetical protein